MNLCTFEVLIHSKPQLPFAAVHVYVHVCMCMCACAHAKYNSRMSYHYILQVTDIMLQDKLYPHWAKRVRKWWNAKYHRIILFWITIIVTSTVVVLVISTDWINWDTLNRDFLPRNELARGFLASFILVLDLVIVMQVCFLHY